MYDLIHLAFPHENIDSFIKSKITNYKKTARCCDRRLHIVKLLRDHYVLITLVETSCAKTLIHAITF